MAKMAYAEAAATPALERATHVYVKQGGVGPPLADNYAGTYLVLEKGSKAFRLQLGERTEVVSRHVTCSPPGEDQDHLQNFRRSLGSYVAGT